MKTLAELIKFVESPEFVKSQRNENQSRELQTLKDFVGEKRESHAAQNPIINFFEFHIFAARRNVDLSKKGGYIDRPETPKFLKDWFAEDLNLTTFDAISFKAISILELFLTTTPPNQINFEDFQRYLTQKAPEIALENFLSKENPNPNAAILRDWRKADHDRDREARLGIFFQQQQREATTITDFPEEESEEEADDGKRHSLSSNKSS